jgi:hypothetical protein
MKLRKQHHGILWVVLFTSLPFCSVLTASLKPTPLAWGEVVNGLQMRISRDGTDSPRMKVPKFRVELRNAGDHDLILNLGSMLANGKKQYPNNIFLTLTDAQGTSRRLDLIGPGIIAGRLDPFVLPIPVDATFSIPVELDKYFAATSKERDYKLTPGTYSLKAEFIGKDVAHDLDLLLASYWNGTVTSNQLRFEVLSR